MKIVVTNYTGERGNWGCQSTSRNLLMFLRSAFKSLPGVEISTVPFPKRHQIDSMHDAIHGDRLHEIYASASPSERDLDLLASLVRERFGRFFDMARAADVIMFQGEGSIGPSQYLRNTRLFGLPHVAARLWRKPVLSLNQTIFAKDRHDEAAIRNLFASFRLIAVREAASLHYARALGLTDAVMCPDMAFLETAPAASSVEVPNGPYFCVTGSAAGEHYDEAQYRRTLSSLREKTGLTPIFLFSRDEDARLASGIDVATVRGSDHPDVAEIIPLLRGAKFVFGGRYHTAVTALSQGTPVILLPGNTFKSEGIGPMLGIDCPVHDIGETAEIVSMAEKILGSEAARRQEIVDATSRMTDVYEDFSSYVVALAEGKDESRIGTLRARLQEAAGSGTLPPSRFERLYRDKNSSPGKRHPLLRRAALWRMRKSARWEPGIASTFSNFG